MHDLSQWDRLAAAAHRVSVLRNLRQFGWLSVVMGSIAALAAIVPPLSPGLLAVGVMLVGTGAWNIRKPSPAGLVVDGASIVVLGVFNALSFLAAPPDEVGGAVRWTALGLFQVGWGIQRISRFRAAQAALADPESIQRLEAVVRDLAKRKAKVDTGVVEFVTTGLGAKRHRVGLYPEGAIGLLDNREAIRLARRDEISIENRGKVWIGRSVKVTVQVGDRQLKGEMPEEHFERFENWKLGVARPQAIAA